MPRLSPSPSSLPILGPSSPSSRGQFSFKRSRRCCCRAALLVLFAGVVVYLSASALLAENVGGNAGAARGKVQPLSVSPQASSSTTAAAAAAAAASTLRSLDAASEADNGAPVTHEHAGEISKELEAVERAKKGDRGVEASSMAQKRRALSPPRPPAAAASDGATGELLTPLRARIFGQQPATEDTTPHGAAGRAERVASLRKLAVAAELEYRRHHSRNGCGVGEASGLSSPSSPPPSPISRSLFPPERLAPSDPNYVATCVVLKDQNIDLPEFIAWHAALGVGTFYLFDHGSSPPVSAAALPAAARDTTKVLVTPLTEAQVAAHPSRIPQMAAYDACTAAHRAEHEWLAFLDVDEFVVISPSSSPAANASASPSPSSSPSSSSAAAFALPSLPLLLSKYEGAASALALHWSMFGSGGRASRKPDSLLTAEAFEACLPRDNGNNRHIKTVASTRMLDVAEPCLGAHHFAYWDFDGAVLAEKEERAEEGQRRKKKKGDEGVAVAAAAAAAGSSSSLSSSPPRRPQPFAVEVEGNRIDGPYSRVAPGEKPPRVPHSPAFLAHYVLKSKEEYEAKMLRGNAMKSSKGWSFFEEVERLSTEGCLEASALAKRIKAAAMEKATTTTKTTPVRKRKKEWKI